MNNIITMVNNKYNDVHSYYVVHYSPEYFFYSEVTVHKLVVIIFLLYENGREVKYNTG